MSPVEDVNGSMCTGKRRDMVAACVDYESTGDNKRDRRYTDMRKKNLYMISVLLTAGMVLSGCSDVVIGNSSDSSLSSDFLTDSEADSTDDSSTDSSDDSSSSDSTTSTASSDYFTDRDLDPSYDESEAINVTLSGDTVTADGDGVEIDGSTITITAAGVYVFTGTLDDGQIVVDADKNSDKVQIVLNGVDITCSYSACIYVKSADKVFITSADGTENTLQDTGDTYTDEDGEGVDGVIYSKDNITFNGSGTLTITANYNHAIVGNDDVKFTGGTYNITAANKGVKANDSIRICDGTFNVVSADDAFHTDGDEDDTTKGYIYISGGTFDIDAGDDGIHAETELIVDGGTINITNCYEGLEGATITINGGDIDVVASDDGFNATGYDSGDDSGMDLTGDMGDGEMPDMSNFDGEMPDMSDFDGEMPEMGGQMPGSADGTSDSSSDSTDSSSESSDTETAASDMSGELPENFDGEMPEMGEMPDMSSSTDAAGGNMGGGMMGGNMGGGMGDMDSTEDAVITINGGDIYIDASGDGIDSNGYLYVYGGTIIVDGPTSDGDGALDTGIEGYIYGGEVIAVGSSGMAETFSSESTQYSVLYGFGTTLSEGTEITITDSDGNELMSYTLNKAASSVIYSSADLTEGTYTITYGDESVEVEISDLSTTAGTTGGMTGGNMGGFGGGNFGDDSGFTPDDGTGDGSSFTPDSTGEGGSFGGGRGGGSSEAGETTDNDSTGDDAADDSF